MQYLLNRLSLKLKKFQNEIDDGKIIATVVFVGHWKVIFK